MGAIGGIEWLVIALVFLLLFGAKSIPELARGLGQGMHEFRKASSEIRNEIDRASREEMQALKGRSKLQNGKKHTPDENINDPDINKA